MKDIHFSLVWEREIRLFSVFDDVFSCEIIFLIAEAAADLDLIEIGKGVVKLFVGEAGERVEDSVLFAIALIFRGEIIEKIVGLIRKYDCAKHVYFMLEPDEHIRQFKAYAPDIPTCVGHLSDRPWEIVDRAIELGAEKVQLFKPYFNQEMIDKAHAHGVLCNVFWSDDVEEARRFIDMGIDTILTNDYLKISNALRPWWKTK